jgi:hypothetical protein
VTTTETVWVARHGVLGNAFFDVDAAAFLAEALFRKRKGGMRAHAEGQGEAVGASEAQRAEGEAVEEADKADGGVKRKYQRVEEIPEVVVACGQHSSYATFEKLRGREAGSRGEGGAAEDGPDRGTSSLTGSAVGPEWVKMLRAATAEKASGRLVVELECEVATLVDGAAGALLFQRETTSMGAVDDDDKHTTFQGVTLRLLA